MRMPSLPTLATILLAIAAMQGVVASSVRAQSLWTPGALPLGSRPAPLVRAAASPGQQCRQAIRAAERAARIPDQLMAAIGRVESGRREPDGSINPWPWSINAEGTDHVFESKQAAVAAVRALQKAGVRSIDVGCMQVNLMHHPDAFATLDEAFDPASNAAYAARFLVQLHEQTGTWPAATAWYHSATPDLGAEYQRKVMAVWPEEQKQRQDNTRLQLASAWAATRPTATAGLATIVRPVTTRVIPLPSGAAGRGLGAYRAMPIPLAARVLTVRPPERQPGPAGGISTPG